MKVRVGIPGRQFWHQYIELDSKKKKKPTPQTSVSAWAPPAGKMCIYPEGSQTMIVIPFAPQRVTYSGFGRVWQEQSRDGQRFPLLNSTARSLPKMAFQVFVGSGDPDHVWSGVLKDLTKIADSQRPIYVSWSSFESGLWRITSMTITSEQRHKDTNEITRATVDFEFTRASDMSRNLGPASGGKKNNNKDKGKGKDKGNKNKPEKYKVKSGDTLQSIGMKFYNDHRAWRKIADKNKITNPKNLKVGQVLVLP